MLLCLTFSGAQGSARKQFLVLTRECLECVSLSTEGLLKEGISWFLQSNAWRSFLVHKGVQEHSF